MPETLLDRASVAGFLRMAAEEGLLRDRDDRGDRLLASLRPCPEWHRQQILEQIILNSKIHTLWGLPFDWLDGELVGSSLLQCDKAPDNPRDAADAVSPEVLEGLLIARGEDRPFDEWIPIVEKFGEVLGQVQAIEEANQGATFKPLEHFVRGMVDRDYRDSQAYQLAAEWNEAHSSVRPLLEVVDEFLTLSEVAASSTRFLKTPVHRMSANLISLKSVAPADSAATRVYRLTTEQLGVLPVCESLRQALEIRRRPEAVALRAQLDQWLCSLPLDVADAMARIQAEIASASTQLVKGSRVARAGQLLGYASIPVSATGIVNPLLGALGFGMTCVAVVLHRTGHAMEERVNWLGFGTRITG